MIRIGIECEQLEGRRFGVGHTLAQLLEGIISVPGVERRYRFVLYFKSEIPRDVFLAHSVFEKKIVTGGLIPRSFNVFYHIVLPMRYFIDRLDCFFFPSYMLPAFFAGKAVVVLTNDVYWEAHHGTLPWRYRFSYRLFCWWAARRANMLMAISRFSATELERVYRIPDSRMFVNPWGLESIFSVLPRDEDYRKRIAALKEKFRIAGDFFISVGQAFPRRRMKEALEAFALIAREYPDVQYLVACQDKYDPPVLAGIASRVNKETGRNAVVFTAQYIDRTDLPYLMNEARALVYISSKEALGLPPLEALACGTPSVMADNALSREIFGEDGFFVNHAQDPAEIAKTMDAILKRPDNIRKILEEQAPHLKRYDWNEHVGRLLAVFDRITGAS
ncbi:hypothetical protein A3C91_04800 [Candidatus Azambacteria bacterium RIFCSPHIGHO2_02_FULL_52_12]|uniref:Glycosyl transferase family 1 domain-containing protein n=1 Tax=Candidatus Azambacteria bacterium RIFCSPLOWO2_01_FULL_46_25 TaxID=1797298 RepID=A0A1F5BVR1_9BACT|nr:MAG: hypothetical protein A3C91_04800 [Candidatus Azambacteria bacterium RIFCSPHIGHO2_02_FULL_52_12]OGD34713.1 MAG: hypothetical protein A2988_04420 [Candidatus Azambacteria bacterium RIFCSPLOWO2_01_FULL_46_25]OGD37014.1 MAG: hypothetical protein A2850_03795 [Candidatus Azambacteria bacterium RIFCSPHIGHO2_01_FULL_51_74]